MTLTVAIPTYGRDQVLVDTLQALLGLESPPWELLVVDQTLDHGPSCEKQLATWQGQGRLRWIRLQKPSITAAMNRALTEARGSRVLFLDDDIIPDPDLLRAHERSDQKNPQAMIAGRVLQPWHQGAPDPDDAPFLFNSLTPRETGEFMGGNVSIPRAEAIELGGFDQNFVKVAYRFEAEFAHRWTSAGKRIVYDSAALIHHLRAERGGTRSYGLHLTTARPDHAVGRYYFFLRTRSFTRAMVASATSLFKSVITRHHLSRPWWIPITLFAETQGFLWGLKLHVAGPSLIDSPVPRLLIAGSHPVQYHTPLFQELQRDSSLLIDVLYLTLPTPETQGLGFGVSFSWDVPLLEGYRWHEACSGQGKGITAGYRGVMLAEPWKELGFGPSRRKPDALLLTGWHFLGMVQLFMAARLRGIPVLLRMDSNPMRPRSPILKLLYWILFRGVSIGLPVGKANARFYKRNGFPEKKLVASPHYVDNTYFAERSDALRANRSDLRREWGVPDTSFCFLFAGKLQAKKQPGILLNAMQLLSRTSEGVLIHLLMVGTGPLEADCRKKVIRHELPVSFTGFLNQSEMPRAYAVSDCLVLPSDHGETWGLVVNEAMACGLPVIVSDQVGCAEDLVQEGRTGSVVPFGDVKALASGMEAIACRPDHADKMGQRARVLVENNYTIEEAAKGIKAGLGKVVT